MASSSETLKLIVTAEDKGSKVLNDIGQSTAGLKQKADQAAAGMEHLAGAHQSLGGASRAIKSGLAQVADEIGATGPAGHVAAFAALHLSEGFTATTGAALGAATALSFLIGAISSTSENIDDLNKLVRSKNVEEFNKKIEELHTTLENVDGPFSDFMNRLLGGSGHAEGVKPWTWLKDLVHWIGGGKQELEALNEQLKIADASHAAEIFEKFQIQIALVDASPVEKLNIQLEQAKRLAFEALRDHKIGYQEFKTMIEGVTAIHDKEVTVANRAAMESLKSKKLEVEALSQYSAGMQKNIDLQLEFQLMQAQRSGDTKAVESLTKQRDVLKETFQLNISLVDVQNKLVSQKEKLATLESTGKTTEAALAKLDIQQSERRIDLIGKEISETRQLREARDNALKIVDPSKQLSAITAAIDQAFRSGNKPAQYMIDQWVAQLGKMQKSAFQTFGINVPQDVQASIDKVEGLIKKIGEASGMDMSNIADKIKQALNGDGGGDISIAPPGVLTYFAEIEKATGRVVELTENWKKSASETVPYFTNILSTQRSEQDEINKIVRAGADQARESDTFGASIAGNTRLVGSLNEGLDETLGKVRAINREGGIKVVQ